jgi:hypothetical protein
MYVIETPTKNILNYGSYSINIMNTSYGIIISELNFGLFKILNMGASWEMDYIIGNETAKFGIPAPVIKISIYEGNSNGFPGFALGYSFQGFIIDGYTDYNSIFMQPGRGLYLVFGSEIFVEGLLYNVGANINNFGTCKVYPFLSLEKTIGKDERAVFKFEIDNIDTDSLSNSRINTGLGVFITDQVGVIFVVRDVCGKKDVGRIPNERRLQLGVTSKL